MTNTTKTPLAASWIGSNANASQRRLLIRALRKSHMVLGFDRRNLALGSIGTGTFAATMALAVGWSSPVAAQDAVCVDPATGQPLTAQQAAAAAAAGNQVICGAGATATAPGAIAVGSNATATAGDSVALGTNATVRAGTVNQTNGAERAVAIGFNSNATSPSSIAIGNGATTQNTASGTDRPASAIAIGTGAMAYGTDSIAIGRGTGQGGQGFGNVAVGITSGQNITPVPAASNGGTAIGASGNVAYGVNSGNNVNGGGNLAIGTSAGNNVSALTDASTGPGSPYCLFPPFYCYGGAGNGSNNTAIGPAAANSVQGSQNIGVGFRAGSFTTGNNNMSMGQLAGFTVNGSGNLASGSFAGAYTTGHLNTAVGNAAGGNVTGSSNVAAGNNAGSLVTGSRNIASGEHAGRAIAGNQNISQGTAAGIYAAGNNNVAIGTSAGTGVSRDPTTGALTAFDGSIIDPAAAPSYGHNDTIAIGNRAYVNADNALAIGSGALTGGTRSSSIGYNATTGNASNAIAFGSGARTGDGTLTNNNAVAIGASTNASGLYSVALGDSASTNGASSAAIGKNASAQGGSSVAVGNLAGTNGAESTAVGFNAKANTAQGTALGNRANASSVQAMALGTEAVAAANQATAVGVKAQARGASSVAVGNSASASGARSVAMGPGSAAAGDRSIAIGDAAQATGQQAISIGTGNVVSGDNSGAIGDPNTVSGSGSYALGNNNTIEADNAFVVGNNVTVASGLDDSVVLGNGSTVDAAVGTPSATIAGTTYDYAGTAPVAAVSVGAAGAERTVTNVAAGRVSSTSTDAINGSQLYAVQQAVEATETHCYSVNDGGTQGGNFNNDGATGVNSLAAGVDASATAEDGVAIGTGALASGGVSDGGATAIGRAASATGDGATALGSETVADAAGATAVGDDANALSLFSTAVGDGAEVAASGLGGLALGADAETTAVGGVALGALSVADTQGQVAGYDPATGAASTNTSPVWRSTLGAVSVGNASAGRTRQITDVAAGTQATDAVNVAQLQSVEGLATAGWNVTATGAGSTTANIGPNGTVSFAGDPNLTVTQDGADDAGAVNIALNRDLDVDSVTAGNSVLDTNGLAVDDGTNSATYGANGMAIAGGPSVTAGGIDAGSSAITNVAAGTADTDAVNVAQLNAVEATANAGFNISAQGANATNVAPGETVDFANVDGNIEVAKDATSDDVTIDLADDIEVASVTAGDSVLDTSGLTVDDGTNSTAYGANGMVIAGGPSVTAGGIDAGGLTIVNVAPGTVSATSTDAINGSQLFATNQAVDQNAADIATNAGNIATNAGDIATNAGSIDTLGQSVADGLGGTSSYDAASDTVTTGLAVGGNSYTTVNDALNAVSDTANAGWNVTATGAGSTTANIGPNGTVTFAGDPNLTVTQDGADDAGAVNIALNRDLDVDSVTAGNSVLDTNGLAVDDGTNSATYGANGMAIAGGPSVTAGGIDAGSSAITNVAAGTADTDAVNVAQLNQATQQIVVNEAAIAEVSDRITVQGESVAQGLGGNSSYNASTGEVTTALNVGETTYSNVNDAINAISATANAGWNIQADGGPATNIASNGTLNVTSGSNVAVSLNGNQLAVAVVDNPTFSGTVTANGGLTVGANQRVDMGGNVVRNVGAGQLAAGSTDAVNGGQLYAVQQVAANSVQYDADGDSVTFNPGGEAIRLQNVAAGVADTDAVNVAQLNSGLLGAVNQANSYTDQRVNALAFDLADTRRDLSAGTAGALAAAGLPQAFEAGKGMLAIGAGTYQGQSAVAMGVSRILDHGKTIIKAGATYNTQSEAGANVGIGFQF